ncbi:twin-arginine translocase subunit TatB [Pseudoxanthomonas sp. SGNA-20]|jgi:twin arginine-targeting protein translocase TatB|uniref:Sec-independent protein translocase protein TatB n=1 Tax=Pseudoxanthomonas taiwanensis J19 TaxID=935569 RepID=A0A562D907_9GAMM|nr:MULTISPECIES: Sec-independent protein translocase protein TatB [Pseudoxanthomonas]RRN53947.1 twin-arginine translocase subunit TatB [Pseudoxanthomonas sp. SGNA-20]RRN78808.1 twin-arginine translocase subunit TatB [Pseudoxanthomonas sp. SGD-10]TWH06096.1 sec-independent protein translocase protein TatB [Pseudoxanthomonas taiwanensis J19]
MFDIGFGELLLIAVVALVVLGPERLPKAARFAGLWVRRARAQWYSVRAELERELAAEELKRSLRETQDSLRQAEATLRQEAEAARSGLDGLRQQVEADLRPPEPAGEAPQPAADPEAPLPAPGSHTEPAPPADPAEERDGPRHS